MFYKFVRKAAYIIARIIFFLRIKNIENIPRTGGVMLCANHRSVWDAVLIAATCKRPLAFIGKEELFDIKPLGFFLKRLNCYPVKRDGGDIAVVKTCIRVLKEGQALLIFPEGERIRKGKKPNPKAGALRIAIMTGVPLVPMGIKGNFKWFRRMEVSVGLPMDVSVYKGKKYTDEEYNAMTWDIMNKIYALAETEQFHD